jgi:hypothetical protein
MPTFPDCAFRLMGTYARGVPLIVKNREFARPAGLRVAGRIGKLPDLVTLAGTASNHGANRADARGASFGAGCFEELSIPRRYQEIRTIGAPSGHGEATQYCSVFANDRLPCAAGHVECVRF